MGENDHILREIIDVEKELQQSLDRAQEEMRIWLETRRKELDGNLAQQERDLTASFERSREDLAQGAVTAYDDLVKAEEKRGERLAHLEHDTLAGIVANHIHKILPG